MTKVKRQHYVPRFYLKKFTYRGLQIFAYDKLADRSFPTSIDNIANEGYFYDFSQELSNVTIETQTVEKGLAGIEAIFSKTLDEFLKVVAKKSKIKPEYRFEMAHFIAIQMLRTKEYRIEQQQLYEKGLTAVIKTMKHNDQSDYSVSVKPEFVPLQHAMTMFNPDMLNSMTQILASHIWFIGVNGTPKPFYTSDHPVVKRGHYEDPLQSYGGIASPGIEIAFPITPNYVLVLCERQAFQMYEKRENKCVILNKDNVAYYNSLQVAQSYRQIYSPKDDFTAARQMCKKFPEIREQDRPRIQVHVGDRPLSET